MAGQDGKYPAGVEALQSTSQIQHQKGWTMFETYCDSKNRERLRTVVGGWVMSIAAGKKHRGSIDAEGEARMTSAEQLLQACRVRMVS